ncbi:hypothetical protein Hypma_008890 [Hypsizygus marmoreus]|uniref:MYND-type domain-containing protein n=1 Tax=Hypsizygus marmoreus TaxID=39966 RepID=A0A369JRD6_HYPMA|nr:hypothetical protein Hypma_008890 [Hypsizygus marmoreus]
MSTLSGSNPNVFSKKLRQLTIGDRLRVPSYDVDAMAWNAAWEKIAAAETPVLMSSATSDSVARRYGEASESMLTIYQSYYHRLCVLQLQLTAMATMSIAKGHIRVSPSTGFEDYRALCGDITLASLEKDNGAGFLKLLEVYLHDDISSVPKTPITFPYNGTFGIPLPSDKDAWHIVVLLDRDLYICFFLLYTLQPWICMPRPAPERMDKSSFSGDIDKQLMEMIKASVKPSQVKELKQVLRAGHAALIRCCESCGKAESTTRHMQCKNCAEAQNRRTSYCSRQCQKDDWQRHKQFCGKKMTPETARNTAIASHRNANINIDPSQIQIGPVVGGYKRSAALIAQVQMLNLSLDTDYSISSHFPMSLFCKDPCAPSAIKP